MQENETKSVSRFIGITLAIVAAIALQAWLVQMSVSFIWPFVVIPFWQWMVIVFTLRSLCAPLIND